MPRRRDEARALFRNAILEAAEAVFAEKGFHGARIQDIAERARIAVGTVYNHFEQKEDVLRALLEERTEELVAELAPRPSDPAAFEARLTARLRRMLGAMDRHRSFFAIAFEHGLMGGHGSPTADQALGGKPVVCVERFKRSFRALVQQGVAEGAIEPLEELKLARFLGATVRAVALSAFEDPQVELADEAALVARLFLHGSAARRTPRRVR